MKETVVLKAVRRSEAKVFPLPGRDQFFYIGPENSPARHLTVSVSVFPPGSKSDGHVHEHEEEIVYVISGRGRLVTPEASADLGAMLKKHKPDFVVDLTVPEAHCAVTCSALRAARSRRFVSPGREPRQ